VYHWAITSLLASCQKEDYLLPDPKWLQVTKDAEREAMGKEGLLEGDKFFLKCLHLFNRYFIEHLSYLLYVNVSSSVGVCRDSVPSETMNKCIWRISTHIPHLSP